jgi:sulfite dehydrogenase (cytochrome) subunit A
MLWEQPRVFQPRVPGGQLGNGAMGNAQRKGVRLKDVLEKAGIAAGARQVTFNGLDAPLIPQTPDFIKAIEAEQALDGETLLEPLWNPAGYMRNVVQTIRLSAV